MARLLAHRRHLIPEVGATEREWKRQIMDAVAPQQDDVVLYKRRASSFDYTELRGTYLDVNPRPRTTRAGSSPTVPFGWSVLGHRPCRGGMAPRRARKDVEHIAEEQAVLVGVEREALRRLVRVLVESGVLGHLAHE